MRASRLKRPRKNSLKRVSRLRVKIISDDQLIRVSIKMANLCSFFEHRFAVKLTAKVVRDGYRLRLFLALVFLLLHLSLNKVARAFSFGRLRWRVLLLTAAC